MALIPRINASGLDGATVAFSTATVAGAGDTLVGGQAVHLLVNNAGGAPVTVTLVTPETVEGTLLVDDRNITVAATSIREIPVPSRYNDPATGQATVKFSAAATVAAVQGSVVA